MFLSTLKVVIEQFIEKIIKMTACVFVVWAVFYFVTTMPFAAIAVVIVSGFLTLVEFFSGDYAIEIAIEENKKINGER